jgi:integrase
MSRPRLDDPNYRLVRRTGRRKWYIAWTEAGQTELVSTGIEAGPEGTEPSPVAKAALKRFMEKQNAPPPEPKIRDLMAKRLEHWKGKRPRKKAAIDRMESFHRFINGFLGDDQPHEVTPERQQAYLAHRGKIAAGRRELEELRSAFNHALKHPAWGVTKVPHIELPEKRPPRDVIMTREQGLDLLRAAKALRPHVGLFVLLAISTGRRHGAILDLTWDRVDWATGNLTFDNYEVQLTKKRRGSCQVGPNVMAALKEAWERKGRKTDYVIEFRGKRLESVKKGFAQAAIDAGLYRTQGKRKVPWVTAHVCKHSVISWMGEDGESDQKIGEYTDTDSATVKRIYKKVNPDAHKGIKDRLDALVSGIIGTGGSKNPKGRKRKKPA